MEKTLHLTTSKLQKLAGGGFIAVNDKDMSPTRARHAVHMVFKNAEVARSLDEGRPTRLHLRHLTEESGGSIKSFFAGLSNGAKRTFRGMKSVFNAAVTEATPVVKGLIKQGVSTGVNALVQGGADMLAPEFAPAAAVAGTAAGAIAGNMVGRAMGSGIRKFAGEVRSKQPIRSGGKHVVRGGSFLLV